MPKYGISYIDPEAESGPEATGYGDSFDAADDREAMAKASGMAQAWGHAHGYKVTADVSEELPHDQERYVGEAKP